MRRINIENPKKLIHKSIGKVSYEGEYDWGYCYYISKTFSMFHILFVELIIYKDTELIKGKEFVKFHYQSSQSSGGETMEKWIKIAQFKNLNTVLKSISHTMEDEF
jgi:hypothetical protein